MTECDHCGHAMQRVSVYCICGRVLPFESKLRRNDANHLDERDGSHTTRETADRTTQATLGDVA